MLQWQDKGFVLAARGYGEGAAILSVLTPNYGRYAGLVRGGTTPKWRPILQPGNEVQVRWTARLNEHLGQFTVEPIVQHSARWLDDAVSLSIIATAAAQADAAFAERDPHPAAFDAFSRLVTALDSGNGLVAFALWERDLLADLGYGLRLDQCAVTGEAQNLAFVSPRTGRAVSEAAADPYRDRLLPLPSFLREPVATGTIDRDDLLQALRLTGFFLDRHVWGSLSMTAMTPIAAARERLLHQLRKH